MLPGLSLSNWGIRRPGPKTLVDDLVIQQYSLSQNVSNNNLKFSFILRQIMDFTHHQTLDLQERLDSLMNGRTPWLLGSGEWRSHLPSGYGLAQRMRSSWPCSKQRFLQRNPESSRNDSNLIHSSDKMNKNATRSPGLLVRFVSWNRCFNHQLDCQRLARPAGDVDLLEGALGVESMLAVDPTQGEPPIKKSPWND